MAELNLGKVKGDPGIQGETGLQGIQGLTGAPGTGIDVITEPVIYITLQTLAALIGSNKYTHNTNIKTYGGWTLELNQPSMGDSIEASVFAITNNTNSVVIELKFPKRTTPLRTTLSLTGTLKKSGNVDIPFARNIPLIIADQGLQGTKGDKGDQGIQGIQGVQGEVGVQGVDGESAYEVAVRLGFIGTEVEWRDSLQGLPGLDGAQGIQGIQGEQGIPGEQGPPGADGIGSGDVMADGSVTMALLNVTGNVDVGSFTINGVDVLGDISAALDIINGEVI